MVDDLQRRVVELRFVEGIEKVEHVPYPTGDEFWVRFNHPLNIRQLEDIIRKNGASMVKFGGLPSKLPRPLAELLWDGVSYVITKNTGGFGKFTAFLGFEPDGICKIVTDAHGPYQIFIAKEETGVKILYEYLGLKYVAPAPPPKPIAPAKPPVSAAAKPASVPPKPVTSPAPSAVQPTPPAPASQPKTTEENTQPKPTTQT
jgi:hypothetical protein